MSATRIVDLNHRGRTQAIGAWVVDDRYLIDPGPVTASPVLREALGPWAPQAILLTHIHLDHAGAAGLLARSWPAAEVWVHERGEPHLVDPGRLVASARRVYGATLDRLWGEPEPVAPERIRILADGDRIGPFRVGEAPGHAPHHLSYLHSDGTAFVGDVAGIRIPPERTVLAPSVAPDFDPVAWKRSLERLSGWRPSSLALTHFGRFRDVGYHLSAVADELDALVATGGEPSRVDAQVDRLLGPLADGVTDAYREAARPETFAAGVRRYLGSVAPPVTATADPAMGRSKGES